MGYSMLLGREAMEDRLLIDSAASFCMGDVTPNDIESMYGKKAAEKSGLKIALLASNIDLYSNQRILEAGEQRGHEMVFLDIKQC